MIRKLTMLILVLTTLMALTSCNNIDHEDYGESIEVEEVNDIGEGIDANPYWVSEDRIILTYHEMSILPWQDDTAVARALTKYTNVELIGTISNNQTDRRQAYNLMIVSGDIPDLVYHHIRDDIMTHAQEGAFIPLNDLIREHAPNIQRYIDENEELAKAITAIDGNIYYVPQIRDGLTAAGYFIREDWLDNLGLEVPRDVDALYSVLKAFKEQDANGNGDPDDEVPFFSRNRFAVTSRLVYLFDAHYDYYVDDGNVKFGPMEAEYKEAISTLVQWYEDGLIDTEIMTRGGRARDIMLNGNIGGVTHDWFGSTAAYNDQLNETIEGFSFRAMLPPASISGRIVEPTVRSSGFEAGTAISSSCKNPVEAIKFLDFCFSAEGRSLLNFGIEGEDYEWVDGKEVFKDHILNAENGALEALRERGAQLEMSFHQDFDYEKQWVNSIALDGMQMYIEEDCMLPSFPILNYTASEKTKIAEQSGLIRTYINEKTQEWILGVSDIDEDFDTYVEQLKMMGIDEILEIHNNALNR